MQFSVSRILLSLILSAIAMTARGEGARVSLLTCGEGEIIYELEGHTGLRIVDDRIGDITVNWGVFDFAAPNFVYRFVKGETDYMAAACSTERFLSSYRRQGRTVREQVLAIDSLQAERLIEAVMINLRPENRVYRYNYVLDNCATRPLALIEKALGDTLTLGPSPLRGMEGRTFRNVMRHYHRNYPWYQFGIDTALGSGIDRPISERETAFAPVVMERMLASAVKADGEQLVTAEGYLVGDSLTPSVVADPTPWYLTPMAAACVVLVLSVLVTARQFRGRGRMARWFDTVWFTIEGIEGLILTFLIFVSVHEATSPNWLYLWLNPACFIGAIAPWTKGWARGLEIWYQSVNFALLIVLAVLFAASVQSANVAFLPLMAATALRSAGNVIYYRKKVVGQP